jgi:hypothetical protein
MKTVWPRETPETVFAPSHLYLPLELKVFTEKMPLRLILSPEALSRSTTIRKRRAPVVWARSVSWSGTHAATLPNCQIARRESPDRSALPPLLPKQEPQQRRRERARREREREEGDGPSPPPALDLAPIPDFDARSAPAAAALWPRVAEPRCRRPLAAPISVRSLDPRRLSLLPRW